jgi:hypothetical protein
MDMEMSDFFPLDFVGSHFTDRIMKCGMFILQSLEIKNKVIIFAEEFEMLTSSKPKFPVETTDALIVFDNYRNFHWLVAHIEVGYSQATSCTIYGPFDDSIDNLFKTYYELDHVFWSNPTICDHYDSGPVAIWNLTTLYATSSSKDLNDEDYSSGVYDFRRVLRDCVVSKTQHSASQLLLKFLESFTFDSIPEEPDEAFEKNKRRLFSKWKKEVETRKNEAETRLNEVVTRMKEVEKRKKEVEKEGEMDEEEDGTNDDEQKKRKNKKEGEEMDEEEDGIDDDDDDDDDDDEPMKKKKKKKDEEMDEEEDGMDDDDDEPMKKKKKGEEMDEEEDGMDDDDDDDEPMKKKKKKKNKKKKSLNREFEQRYKREFCGNEPTRFVSLNKCAEVTFEKMTRTLKEGFHTAWINLVLNSGVNFDKILPCNAQIDRSIGWISPTPVPFGRASAATKFKGILPESKTRRKRIGDCVEIASTSLSRKRKGRSNDDVSNDDDNDSGEDVDEVEDGDEDGDDMDVDEEEKAEIFDKDEMVVDEEDEDIDGPAEDCETTAVHRLYVCTMHPALVSVVIFFMFATL